MLLSELVERETISYETFLDIFNDCVGKICNTFASKDSIGNPANKALSIFEYFKKRIEKKGEPLTKENYKEKVMQYFESNPKNIIDFIRVHNDGFNEVDNTNSIAYKAETLVLNSLELTKEYIKAKNGEEWKLFENYIINKGEKSDYTDEEIRLAYEYITNLINKKSWWSISRKQPVGNKLEKHIIALGPEEAFNYAKCILNPQFVNGEYKTILTISSDDYNLKGDKKNSYHRKRNAVMSIRDMLFGKKDEPSNNLERIVMVIFNNDNKLLQHRFIEILGINKWNDKNDSEDGVYLGKFGDISKYDVGVKAGKG